MLFQTSGQSYEFLTMVAAGAAGGFWYSLLRRIRRRVEAGVFLTLAADLAYGAGLFCLLALALFRANHFELRLYALMGAACGHLLYLSAVPPAMDGFLRALGRLRRRFARTRVVKNFLQFFFK